jgi:hypothetical protein
MVTAALRVDVRHALTDISLPGEPAESMGDRLKRQAILDEKIKKFLAVRFILCSQTGSLLFIIMTVEMCNIDCWNFYVCVVFLLLLLLLQIYACLKPSLRENIGVKGITSRQC